jgi:hypothetical protein
MGDSSEREIVAQAWLVSNEHSLVERIVLSLQEE